MASATRLIAMRKSVRAPNEERGSDVIRSQNERGRLTLHREAEGEERKREKERGIAVVAARSGVVAR